jgi:hypothetical protein
MRNTISSTVANPRSRWIVVVLCVLGTMHLLTLSQNHTAAEDSARYITDVTWGRHLFDAEPNHLLFKAINWPNYRLWSALGYSGDATVPMQLVSATASLVSVYLVYRTALRVGAPPLMALAAAGWTAFSYGFWVYSVEVDPYLPPIPFVLLSILVLFDVRPTDWRGLTSPATTRLIALGVLTAIATLIHQQYVFLLLIVGLTLTLIWRATPGRTPASLITTVGIYSVTGVGLIALTYILVGAFALGFGTIFETIAWARGLATHGLWTRFSPESLILLPIGFGLVIFEDNFLGSPHAASVSTKMPDEFLMTQRYLADHYIGTTSFWLIVGAMLTALVAIAWLTYRLVRSRASAVVERLSPRWIFTRFAVAYLVLYALLILIWEPGNLERFIGLVPVIAILVACHAGSENGVILAGLVLVGALFVGNLVGAVWPYSRADSDYWTNQNAGFAALAHRGDLIVTDCQFVCDVNLGLSTGADVINASSNNVDVLASALASPARGRVFVSSWAFGPPEGVADTWTAACTPSMCHNIGSGKVLSMLEGIRSRLVEVGRSGSQVIWQVAPTTEDFGR